MKMIFSIPAVMAALVGSAAAHSWLECVDTDVPNKAYYQANPSATVEQTCNGYPRNKIYNGDWISESSYYAYGYDTDAACKAIQQVPGQTATGAPMATATPGAKLLMRFWGNGHTRWDIGSPNHRDPGLVRIFWAGKPETEIANASQLTEAYWIKGAQANFSADTITELYDDNTKMNEKANYFTFNVPEKIQNGRHMMVWSWAWKSSLVKGTSGDPNTYDASWDNAWGTCFDLFIENSTYTEEANTDILANDPNYDASAAAESEKSEICSNTCYRGGMTSSPCTGSDCPPCWYKTDGQINCFAYSSGTTCPWSGAYDCSTGTTQYKRDDVASHHRRSRKHRRNL